MLEWLRKKYRYYNIYELSKYPLLWLYAAYLTIRYVDENAVFPAVKLNGFVRVKIKKKKSSLLIIKSRLIFEPFLNGDSSTTINLGADAKLIIERDFILGDGIKIFIHSSATLLLKGKEQESASGITANAVIMAIKYVEIGKDCIIAWDTFITDCDWHSIDNKRSSEDTIIGDHVWIGVAAKILKGVIIGQDSIITSNTVVLKGTYPAKTLISGNPGKVIKTEIPNWHRDMIN